MELPDEIRTFIQESTGNYGKVKLVLHRNKFWVESPYPDILRMLLKVGLLAIGTDNGMLVQHLLMIV